MIKFYVFPSFRYRREYPNCIRMALQKHFLNSCCKSEIPFKRKRAVSKLRLTGSGLVAIGMESIFQTETIGKGS